MRSPDPDDTPLPKVTPSLLRGAEDLCARRPPAASRGAAGSGAAVGRARLREAFLDAARTAHAEGGPPRLGAFHPPSALEPEERAVFAHAAGWYGQLFGTREVTTHLHDCEHPTPSARRGVRVGGWVDVTVVGADGTKELRQLDLWSGRAPPGDDPLALESVWLAVLRLSRWAGDAPFLVSWADLVGGALCQRVVHLPDAIGELRERFDERLALVRARISEPEPAPGRDCGSCRHVWRCPSHPEGINVGRARNDLRPGVIALTPTALESWHRCPRAWRNDHLLDLPESDEGGSPDHGQHAHDVLRLLHQTGSCHDPRHVDDVLAGHGADDRLRAEVARHRERCPVGAEAVGHEFVLARFHRDPWPPFMATARLDAVWVHDGYVDARDYKTGRLWHHRVADDPRAAVQAFVLAPLARARGLRLRLRYEYLSSEVVEDPDPWELDDAEVAAAEERLRAVVAEIRAVTDWTGVADADVCRSCGYRSICPDSAAPSEPAWPAVVPADTSPAATSPAATSPAASSSAGASPAGPDASTVR